MVGGVSDPAARAEEFEALRSRLQRIAYATLGSVAEAWWA